MGTDCKKKNCLKRWDASSCLWRYFSTANGVLKVFIISVKQLVFFFSITLKVKVEHKDKRCVVPQDKPPRAVSHISHIKFCHNPQGHEDRLNPEVKCIHQHRSKVTGAVWRKSAPCLTPDVDFQQKINPVSCTADDQEARIIVFGWRQLEDTWPFPLTTPFPKVRGADAQQQRGGKVSSWG